MIEILLLGSELRSYFLGTEADRPAKRVVETDDVRVVILGDVLHHRRQLHAPTESCAFDVDPDEAIRTRTHLLRHLEQPGTTLAAGHLRACPFGRLTRGPTGLLLKPIGQRI